MRFPVLVVGVVVGAVLAANAMAAELRVAVLPDQAPETLRERYRPLLDHLENMCDVRPELMVPDDYADLVEAFAQGRADLGWFGGVTFVMARRRAGVEPLVMRDIDTRFTSWFIAQADDSRGRLEAFEGATFIFGSPLSNSAHLRPRHYLEAHADIAPGRFFRRVRHADAHDAVVRAVAAGNADLGAVNAEVVRAMQKDGRLAPDAIKVVAKTPPYAAYVWATRAGMPRSRRTCLRNAFLRLDFGDPDARAILRRQGARAYFPASLKRYRTLIRQAERLDILETPSEREGRR